MMPPLRRLAAWARLNSLPPRLDRWSQGEALAFIEHCRLSGCDVRPDVQLIRRLHRLAPLLSGGGLGADPWPGVAAYKVSGAAGPPPGRLSTPAVDPGLWFPLVKAAWTYVHVFARDILRVRGHYRALQAAATTSALGFDDRLEAYLAAGGPIPLHHPDRCLNSAVAGRPNLALLTLFCGTSNQRVGNVFRSGARYRHQRVERALAAGHPVCHGITDGLQSTERGDGTSGAWHPGLSPDALRIETDMLRTACLVLTLALSMMRDSELQEIRRGCLTTHYDTPAISSHQVKGHDDLPSKAWWIIEPVAEAITVAEQITVHPERLFSPAPRPARPRHAAHADTLIDSFIAHVNRTAAWTGLTEIPPGRARPHMFRRTMAMLTDQFPGSEIALGIQLKHVATRALANSSTQAYAAPDPAWARHLTTAIDAARFRRLEELYLAHKDGRPIGHGGGAAKATAVFDHVQATTAARHGDATVERALLKNAGLTIRFGSLNHCTYDPAIPAGALCLENAALPAGADGPLPDRCRPDRCPNSIIAPEHLPLYDAHRHQLLALLDRPGLPPGRRAVLERELDQIGAVLDRAPEDTP
ncbi:integrase [Kitasatospora sp. NPDC096077]|uniref:integrase n=1 Tax=Kitasatospora sp. NPDC096077 TaxID=3155544 RepID=UPI003318C7EB